MTAFFYLLTITLPLATILIAFWIWYRASVMKVRATLANDGAYQKIAQDAAKAQADTAAALSAIQASLADVQTRLASVEKVLKAVG